MEMKLKLKLKLKLKQCPFCGENGYGVHLQKIVYANEDFKRWEVMCEMCGARISEFVTPERAIDAWNTRKSENGLPADW